MLISGVFLMVVAVVMVAYPLWWNHRSSTGAKSLLIKEHKVLAKTYANSQAGKACTPTPGPGVIQIPTIGLNAPVEQGLEDAVLNVAVGHDPSTPWPGPANSTLLAAHDVSFFSQLGALKVGDTVTYTVPCATYTYEVTAMKVSGPGQSIATPAAGSLILDTCYPPNALWYTPDRYVVTATYVTTAPQNSTAGNVSSVTLPSFPNLTVPLPSGLSPTSLTLSTNTQEMGHMTFSGTPTPNFEQSNAPLQVEAAALEAWFAAIHTLEQSNSAWWSIFAPNVTMPTSLLSSTIASTSPLEVNENVQVESPSSVTLSGGLNGHLVTAQITLHGSVATVTSYTVS